MARHGIHCHNLLKRHKKIIQPPVHFFDMALKGRLPKRNVRKHLNATHLIKLIRKDFQQVLDHRAGNSSIFLDDYPDIRISYVSAPGSTLLVF